VGRLDGKVALITGTGGGQGRAAAQIFAREGAKIIGADLKVEGNKETRQMVDAEGGTMISFEPVDLSVPKQAEEFVETAAAEWGGLDIVYNNASAQNFVPFGEITLDEWTFTMKNDLELVFLVTRYAWKHLIARGGGSIINTASGAGIMGTRSTPTVAHSTAKGGVMGFTRALAAEAAAHHIRVNCIAPGLIETPVSAEILASDVGKEMARGIPAGRIGKPEDIAYFALYLASDESTYVTGTTFAIDGGTTTILP
jgi:meso-butanediol dehydrogenase / (S,S)-butanediol dehydrogenase / diacetyl reductase